MQKATPVAAIALVAFMAAARVHYSPAAPNSGRKVTSQIEPQYPQIAKRTHMHGVVKLELVGGANGGVKSSRVIGGSPVLRKAADEAVVQWRFEPWPSETKEVVQFMFHPK